MICKSRKFKTSQGTQEHHRAGQRGRAAPHDREVPGEEGVGEGTGLVMSVGGHCISLGFLFCQWGGQGVHVSSSSGNGRRGHRGRRRALPERVGVLHDAAELAEAAPVGASGVRNVRV